MGGDVNDAHEPVRKRFRSCGDNGPRVQAAVNIKLNVAADVGNEVKSGTTGRYT